MSYQVPYSSSPAPSTPDRKSNNGFSFGDSQNPSTTPAGPPPSSTASFTPAGAPPSSVFGSSNFGPTGVRPLSFSQQSGFAPKSSPPTNFGRSRFPQQRSGLSHEFSASQGSEYEEEEPEEDEMEGYSDEDQPHDKRGGEEEEQEEEEEEEEEEEYSGDDVEDQTEEMDEDDGDYDDDNMDDYQTEDGQARKSTRELGQSTRSDLLLSTPGRLKEGRMGLDGSLAMRFQVISKNLYKQMDPPPVDEADDIVLKTESAIARLYAEGISANDDSEMRQDALCFTSGELITLWEEHFRNTTPYSDEEFTATIGPGPKASDYAKANFIAGLALQLHHPGKVSRPHAAFDRKATPLPQTLLSWMDLHHRPYASQVAEIQSHRPSPANHPLFWDIIFNSLLRGKVVDVVNILKDAGWRYARNGTDDPKGESQSGFSGVALSNIERVIHAAVEVLSQCPAVRGDWNIRRDERNIRSSDWQLFRMKIAQSLEALKNFAEGNSRDRGGRGESLSLSQSAYSRTARRAESQVPWHIYQNLVTLYALLMGEKSTIIENSQDWLEATIGLVVWWDEYKDDRQILPGTNSREPGLFYIFHDDEFYLEKLKTSFEVATNSSTDFQVNTADEVEVALASLFERDNESVIGFLRGWSGPLSAAVAEIATIGGWLPMAEERALITMEALDQDDLDLLGVESPSKSDGVKDMTLITYARMLARRGQLRSSFRPQIIREGWELAIAVLGRLESTKRSEEMVGDFLSKFALESSATVDKLWRLLNDLGMTRHAENTAKTYADYLAEESHKYGEALWYYALAHKGQKVKEVLDLLISFSLVQSTAFPASAELDDHLKNLISSPRATLTEMSQMDLEAAELLQKSLSGYATLRRFFDIRDEDVSSPNKRPQRSTSARKLEAANALMAVINSSDDNIRGGLYDESRGAVVSVDFLLALLGEAMAFVNQTEYTLTTSQINTLLKAIEDIQTVGPRVYEGCTEFLQTVVASGQGLKGSTPSDMLRKTNSGVSGTSGSFEMVGSSLLASQVKMSMSMSGSGNLGKGGNVKRGWDWRRGMKAGLKGDELLRVLRLGLAKDLARAWVKEADGLT